MKQLTSIVVLGLLLSQMAAGEEFSGAAKKIADFETALGEAMIHKDVATLSKLVADDWTMQSETGQTGTKAEFIHDIQSGTLVVTSFKLHDVHIRVFGNVAYVQASDDEQSSYAGKDGSGTYNWLDVWENRNGQWVSIATQLTRVKSTPQ